MFNTLIFFNICTFPSDFVILFFIILEIKTIRIKFVCSETQCYFFGNLRLNKVQLQNKA